RARSGHRSSDPAAGAQQHMSSANPAELTAPTVIERIESGEYAHDVVMTIARGFLPLAQDDNISVLSFLATRPDNEVAQLARTSLKELPPKTVLAFATNERAPSDYLAALTRATEDHAVLEALIRNR